MSRNNMATPDRIAALALIDAVVGMDFVYVAADQVTLSVFFHPCLPPQTADVILGVILPLAAFLFRVGPKIIRLAYEMVCALVSWPFM